MEKKERMRANVIRVTEREREKSRSETVYYFSALSGPYHPSHVVSSPTTQSPPVAERVSFCKLRHRHSLGVAIASYLAIISPVERAHRSRVTRRGLLLTQCATNA